MRLYGLSLALMVASCGSDHADDNHHAARPAVCDEIATQCDPFATTSAAAKECHESAHEAWTAEKCTAERSRCLALCVATDAATDAAETSATDAAPDASDAAPGG